MNRNLRILHVNHAAGWRGGEQQTLYLLQGLADRGVRSVLATPGQGILAERAENLGVPIVELRARGDLDWRARRILRPIARQFDLVHAHTAKAHGWVRSSLFALKNRPKIVVTRRVDYPLKGGLGAAWKYGGVDRLIAISECVSRVMQAGGIQEDKIRLVYSGVRQERFHIPRDRDGLKAELGIRDAGAKIIGFIGALVDHKAPDVLLEAFPRLSARAHLAYAGHGNQRHSLEARARELGVLERVHFLERRDDVPRLMRSVDLFVLPSRMEGLGTSILDAMAAGTPVIAGRTGGIPEIVEDGKSGLLVTPESREELEAALHRVLGDSGLVERLTRGGLERVRKFTQDAMVEGTLDVYEEVLERRS